MRVSARLLLYWRDWSGPGGEILFRFFLCRKVCDRYLLLQEARSDVEVSLPLMQTQVLYEKSRMLLVSRTESEC